MAIDQSRTQWNPAKKNAAGKVIQKGYLSQYGKPEKRVTGTVAIKQAASGVAAGGQRTYKAGRAGVTAGPFAARKTQAAAGRSLAANGGRAKQTDTSSPAKSGDSRNAPGSNGASQTYKSSTSGSGLRGTASPRGQYTTKKPATPAAKPAATSGKPKMPTTAERRAATGGATGRPLVGDAQGNVRTTKNQPFQSPGPKPPRVGETKSFTRGRKTETVRWNGKDWVTQSVKVRPVNYDTKPKTASGPKVGDTRPQSVGVGYVQTQKYTKSGWVNVGPKRKTR